MNLQIEPVDFFADRIAKEYPTPGEPLRILDGVSVTLRRGQNLAVVGPSGSGKSTFLHIAGTLDTPSSGTVTLLGTDLCSLEPKKVASFRNQHIGFIFQEHYLLPQLSALENVLIPLVANTNSNRRSSRESADRGKELLERVGLQDRMRHLPSQLSGGERQRVAVARALVCQPELILADEPTGSLDPVNAEKIGALLLDLQQTDHSMLICVTHSDRLAGLFQSQVRLLNGKFV
jgi:lipoprotein-releasing system ATP-binding protein